MTFDLPRRVIAELIGTAVLVTAVVGSGIMADRLTPDAALALLCNTVSTGAILVALIATLGPVSGAHFNPAVTAVFLLGRRLSAREASGYILAQITGGIVGVALAHVMFELPLFDPSATMRAGQAQWIAEAIATFGLLGTILAGVRFKHASIASLVGLYITAAYWFTASTSFANPAVTLARSLTNTFAGIRPQDVPAFMAAQMLAAVAAYFVFDWLLRVTPVETDTEETVHG